MKKEKGQQVKTKSRQDILGMIVSKSGWKENGTGYKEQVIKFKDGKEITIYYDKESGMYGKMAERILGTKDWYSTFEEAVVQAYSSTW